MSTWIKKLQDWSVETVVKSEEGAVGYLVAWLLGIPASILLIFFLFFGR